jgi:calcineurin-like phosphoesterase family protein
MVNTWFTSDFHLGHRNIIRYCSRPFASVEEMDAAILANLNNVVRAQDVLYFLGDFCLGGPDQALRYRDRIVCRNIHLVEGNHDEALRDVAGAFSSSNQLVEVRVGNQRIVLCHYAMRVWHHARRGVWHLYGHSHGNLADDPATLSIDVGVDSHDFRPWHFDEITTVMNAKRKETSHK